MLNSNLRNGCDGLGYPVTQSVYDRRNWDFCGNNLMVNWNPYQGNDTPLTYGRIGNYCFACGEKMAISPTGKRLEWRRFSDGKIMAYAHVECKADLSKDDDAESVS